jgi:Fe-S oxidoreductase/uncharacterized membrane protein YdjX (TVP38/TMEM64 family)
MSKQKRLKKDFSSLSVSPQLREALHTISDKCLSCKFCKQECAFLQKYGKPKHIADSYDPSNKNHQGMAFECSLCELCAAVCPVDIHPADMFLEMRREAVRSGHGDLSEHKAILAYEKRGTSKHYTYYALPKGCDTVFFPGCTLPGTRPDTTWSLFEHLRKTVPSLGIVLDCCTKPSHDLGRDDYFTAMFAEMRDFLVNHGILNVIVACPYCYKIFSTYGGKLSVKMVYEFLDQDDLPTDKKLSATITVHDPCAVRYESSIHAAVRDLCTRQGLSCDEMPHHKEKTLCCGEGGSVGFVSPELAKKWAALRKGETNDNRIITYCAGCANFLGVVTPTSHVLDLLFQPEATLAGKAKVSKAPWTYLNRLRLKKRLKNAVDAAITRERTFTAAKEGKKGGPAQEEKEKTAPALKKSLINKGIALAVMAAVALVGYMLVSRYWYFLNAYAYTLEFYGLFVANNLKKANLDMFKEFLSSMNHLGPAFPMILYSHVLQNFWLPFTKQILPQAAISSFGLNVGGLYTYLSFVIIGSVSFGLGVFFLGDIVPFFQARSQKDYSQWLTQHSAIPLILLLAVPYVPISIPGVVAGSLRIPWKTVLGLMLLGLAVRALWLISVPQMFT